MGRLGICGSFRRTGLAIVGAWLVALLAPASDGFAYSAAGDRIFAAGNLLPQIAPSDQIYAWGVTVPLAGGGIGAGTRATNIGTAFEKTITERFSVHLEEIWLRVDRVGLGSLHGFQNFQSEFKFMPVNDHEREFLLTLSVNREWGGTGARWISPDGSTTPRVYFGKGLGDLDLGYLRPLAITGFAGYQAADTAPRPDLWTTGFTLQYSIPYLQSKVQSFGLPEPVRGMTPMTEVFFAIPAGRSFGARTNILVAPGLNFAGDGWEFMVAAVVPATRAAGKGVGVRAQFHLALDFLFPDTFGRPLFSQR